MTTFQRIAKMPTRVRTARHRVEAHAGALREPHHLGKSQQGDGYQGADDDLDDHLEGVEPGMDHEVQGLEGLVRFVDAVDEVEHLEGEVDDEGVEKVARDGVDAVQVDGPAP